MNWIYFPRRRAVIQCQVTWIGEWHMTIEHGGKSATIPKIYKVSDELAAHLLAEGQAHVAEALTDDLLWGTS